MKIVCYRRVSTPDQVNNKLSMEDQTLLMEDWAKQNGATIAHHYVEDGKSARGEHYRPAFDDMIFNCIEGAHGKIDAILVYTLSRFYRDLVGFVHVERKLKKHGIRVLSMTEENDDPFVRKIIMLCHEHLSLESSKNSKRTAKRNVQNGFHHGKPAFGYKSVATELEGYGGKPRKRLMPDPNEAALVVELFELAAGLRGSMPMGAVRLLKLLVARGSTMRGRPWQTDKIHSILSDRMYCGQKFWNKFDSDERKIRPKDEWIEMHCPALVSTELFDTVQAIRTARVPYQFKQRPQRNEKALLAGLLRCGVCGRAYWTATYRSGTKKVYKDSAHFKRRAACRSKNIPMPELDQLVLDTLVDEVLRPDRVQLILRQLSAAARRSGSVLAGKRARLATANERIERLYRFLEAGGETDDVFRDRLKRAQNDREAASYELQQEEGLLANLINGEPSQDQVQDICREIRAKVLALPHDQKRTFINLYVSSIVVRPDQIEIEGPTEAMYVNLFSPTAATGVSVDDQFSTRGPNYLLAQGGIADKVGPLTRRRAANIVGPVSGGEPDKLGPSSPSAPSLPLRHPPWRYVLEVEIPSLKVSGGHFAWGASDASNDSDLEESA